MYQLKTELGFCRCHAGMQEEECLQRVRGGVDLVLDTTYCQPQYVFPRQEEVHSSALQLLDWLEHLPTSFLVLQRELQRLQLITLQMNDHYCVEDS